jgi:hypothetical protein
VQVHSELCKDRLCSLPGYGCQAVSVCPAHVVTRGDESVWITGFFGCNTLVSTHPVTYLSPGESCAVPLNRAVQGGGTGSRLIHGAG